MLLEVHGTQEILLVELVSLLISGLTYIRPVGETISRVIRPVVSGY